MQKLHVSMELLSGMQPMQSLAIHTDRRHCKNTLSEPVPGMQEPQDPPRVPHSSSSAPVSSLPGLQQVWQLAKWLETETLHFNETFAQRQLSSPALEFLLVATKQARQLHSKAFYELTKQVMITKRVPAVDPPHDMIDICHISNSKSDALGTVRYWT